MANIEKVENLRAIYIKIGGEKCISLVCFTLAEVFQDFPLLSSSIYLFAPQISQKMVEHLKVLISRAP